MKNPQFLSIYLFVLTVSVANAQNGIVEVGARPASMAYTLATLHDEWSVFNNPGALGKQESVMTLFSYENRYGIEGLNNISAGILAPLPHGVASLGVFRFGDDLYNEQNIALGYGNTFGIASLGVRVNYRQYTLEGFGNRGIITLDFGGIAKISEELHFGAFIRNINQAQLSDLQNERVPTVLNAGCSYQPAEKIVLNAEVEKDIDLEASFKSGMEYNFLPKFSARTGIRTKPFTNYYGMGFKTWKITIDYALTMVQVLGSRHQVSLAYRVSR